MVGKGRKVMFDGSPVVLKILKDEITLVAVLREGGVRSSGQSTEREETDILPSRPH
jgi:hypothetical protein